MNIFCVMKPLNLNVFYLMCRQKTSNFSSIAVNINGQTDDALQFEGVKGETKRDKSGLLQQHKNILRNKNPYSIAHSWIHSTEKYQRKMFARYGLESGVDPRICFPKKNDIQAQALCEKQIEPKAFADMVVTSRFAEQQQIDEINRREEAIFRNMEKLEQWKKDLQNKMQKKEADALAAKQRKERLIEEVRRHFGYKVDPRDEKFKEVLEQKEKEEKKVQREAKRQAKEQKLMAKLAGNSL